MVIQCKQCETRYNFDESVLHGGQSEVRCVRCKNVFTIDSTSTIIAQPIQPIPEVEPATAPEPMVAAADLQSAPEPAPVPVPVPEWDADSDAFSFDNEEPSLAVPSSESATISEEPASQEFTFESLEAEPEVVEPAPLAPPVTEEPVSAEEEVNETPQPKAEKRKTSKFMIFLLLIILIIAGAYGYFFVTLGTTDVMKMIQNIQQQIEQQLQQQPQAQSQQSEIRISTTQSYYVDNSIAGQLFVIKGLATNNYTTAQSELCVKGTLYQKKGAPLLHQTVYCGNVISDEELKSAPMDSLSNQMANPFGAALSNVNVASGQSLPFMIVFTDLPDELNEFSVEPSSSKAASN